MVAGFIFTDDSVGISGTAEGPQERIEKAPEYTRRWRVTANLSKCVVLVRKGDERNPGEF